MPSPNRPYDLDVRLGNETGWELDIMRAHSDLIDTTERHVWEGAVDLLTFPATAELLAIASDDAADTIAGIGARKVKIDGLGELYEEISEIVELNGLTKVLTLLEYRRVNKLTVIEAGSTRRNSGNITIADNGDAFTLGAATAPINGISPGWGMSASGIYTVPAGKIVITSNWQANISSGKAVSVKMDASIDGGPWSRLGAIDAGESFSGLFAAPAMPEKTDLQILGTLSSGAGATHAMIFVNCWLFTPNPGDE